MEAHIERLFERLKYIPELKRKIESLRQAYILDPKIRPEIEWILYSLADKYKDELILEPPPEEECRGDLYIGHVFCKGELYPFYLRTSELTRHMAIYGSSGSGKTTLVDRIAFERIKTEKPILIFDWDGSHRHLLKRPEAKDLKYYTVGSPLSPLCFNPFLVPEDFSMDERITFFTSLLNSLVERHLPGSSVTKRSIKIYLRKILIEQFLSKGIKSFTFSDLQRAASYKRSYISVEDFLSQFVYGPLGRVLNANPEKQISIDALFSQQSLIDLGYLVNPEERADFVDLLLSYAYEVFFKRGKVPYIDNTLKIMIIIEEVHGLFHHHENIISSFFREFRKWGGGLVITDQNPSAIPRFVRGNTFYTVVLHLGSKEDIEIMSRAMMLNGEERHYLTMLQSGKGIGIMKMQSRFTSPFLIKIAALEHEQGDFKNALNNVQTLKSNPDNPGNKGNSKRNQKVEHEYWKERIYHYFKEKGYEVFKEKPVLGGKVDLVVNLNGMPIAFEIETEDSHVINNIRKCLNAGFELIYIVSTKPAFISSLLRREGLDKEPRVRVIGVKKFA